MRGKKIEKSPEAIEEVELRPGAVTKEDLSSEVQILTSPDVIERTIAHLKEKNLYRGKMESTTPLSEVKRFLREKNPFKRKTVATPLTAEVYDIKASLKTEIVPASNVIEIAFFHREPAYAVVLLQSLMDQYTEYRLQVYNPNEAELFFSQQAEGYRGKLEGKEKEMMDLVEKTEVAEPQKELENNILLKADLEKQLSILKNEAIEKRLYVEHLDRALRGQDTNYFSFIENKPINDLSGRLQELFVERGKLLRAYNPASDKVKLVDKQIEETYSLLKSEVKAYRETQFKLLQIANDKIANAQKRIRDLIEDNIELRKQAIGAKKIERDADLYEFSYEVFSKRREEAKTVSAENVPSQVSIVKKAFPSDGPVFPKRRVVIPFGILVGFITGCSLGFMRQYFDHTFKKPSDVYNYAGLPVIFSIPHKEHGKPLS